MINRAYGPIKTTVDSNGNVKNARCEIFVKDVDSEEDALREIFSGSMYDTFPYTITSAGIIERLEEGYYRCFIEHTNSAVSANGVEKKSDKDSVTLTYSLQNQDIDLPLSSHDSYLYCWDHHLYYKSGTADYKAQGTALWNSAKNAKMTVAQSNIFKWLGADTQVPAGYAPFAMMLKPGVHAYRSGVQIVTAHYSSIEIAALESLVSCDYTCKAPKYTFSLPATAGCWLQGGSSVTKRGEALECQVSWVYMPKGWDKDLYLGGSAENLPDTGIVGGGE